MSPYASYLVETLVTLFGVCAIAFAVLYGARRLGVGRPTGGIELIGQLPLDARRSIVLVRVGAQVLIVGVGEAGFTKLGETDVASLPPREAAPAPFADVLARALRRARKGARDDAPGDPERGDP